ncbi:MAG: universal stress protein, partial [Rudaea sp.]
ERGNVARNIFAHTAELGADLVMLTSHGRSGWREVVFGNIAQQVIQSGSVPVFVVRPDTARSTFEPKQIAVPLDGNPVHEPSLQLAAELAKYYSAALHLVLVVPTAGTLSPERAATGVLLPTSTRAVLELAEREAVDYLQGKVNELKEQKLKVSAEVERGAAAAKILEAAGRANADLYVLSTHGRAGLGAFWEGSVTPQVMMHARAPVLLLRVFGEERPH